MCENFPTAHSLFAQNIEQILARVGGSANALPPRQFVEERGRERPEGVGAAKDITERMEVQQILAELRTEKDQRGVFRTLREARSAEHPVRERLT